VGNSSHSLQPSRNYAGNKNSSSFAYLLLSKFFTAWGVHFKKNVLGGKIIEWYEGGKVLKGMIARRDFLPL